MNWTNIEWTYKYKRNIIQNIIQYYVGNISNNILEWCHCIVMLLIILLITNYKIKCSVLAKFNTTTITPPMCDRVWTSIEWIRQLLLIRCSTVMLIGLTIHIHIYIHLKFTKYNNNNNNNNNKNNNNNNNNNNNKRVFRISSIV